MAQIRVVLADDHQVVREGTRRMLERESSIAVAGGAAIGVWASRLFISFFQAADKDVLRPPTMVPLVAWVDIGQISGAFIVALVVAQVIVIGSVLRKGVFQALRMGDQE
jgi:hypothetical protein